MTDTEHEYVLGTNDEELTRLGLQHRVWRRFAQRSWEKVGITNGSKVLDVGCGPGYCSLDIAEIAAPTGHVVGVEQSKRFLKAARTASKLRHIDNAEFVEQDLMSPLRCGLFDVTWCRWVACFVPDTGKLVRNLASSLKPGGLALFHEYVDYGTWRLVPRCTAIDEFVHHVMSSWRSAGGEPNAARVLPTTLRQNGFTVRSAKPLVFSVSPQDFTWQWPSAFIESNLRRLHDLGCVKSHWIDNVRREFAAREKNPETIMITPMVLEIIAERD